jgi:hypothetical protein
VNIFVVTGLKRLLESVQIQQNCIAFPSKVILGHQHVERRFR